LAHHLVRLVADFHFDGAEKHVRRLFACQPGDSLQLDTLSRDELIDLRAVRFKLVFSLGEQALALLESLGAPVEVLLFLYDAALLALHLRTSLASILLGAAADFVCLVLRLEDELLCLCL